MLGSDKVKAYFDNPAATVYPLISGEWNYNLIYEPYVTFSGVGNNLVSDISTLTWSKGLYGRTVSISNATNAKVATGLTNTKSVKLTVNATDTITASNFDGSVSVNIPLPTSAAKCYKVIFYARSIDTNIVSISTSASNSGVQLSSSNDTQKLDSFTWQKVETTLGVKPTDTAYSNFDLAVEFTNTTLDTAGIWGVELCHMQVYEITYFDYCFGKMWPTSSPFTFFRPGESYVSSGNSSITPITRIRSDIDSSSWNNAIPVSPVVYSPKTLFSANSNPAYKNGNLSPFSQYRYFVSEVPDGSTSIGATYEDVLEVNKLVLKFNLSQSVPANFRVTLYNTANSEQSVASIDLTSKSISDAGLCVVYWDGTSWSTNKWVWAPDSTSAMPQINAKGQITISQKINKVVLTQTTTPTVISNYSKTTYNKSNKTDVLSEFTRMQVIEISPRLELDLSSFVIDYSVTKELDSKTTPLPISAMSANSATISLSNIPLAGTKNVPLSVFSTNANDTAVFVSPLKNLLTKNVKFYINYFVPDTRVDTLANRIIPAGVFYADTWSNQDIKVAKVNLYDITKFLQTVPVVDYVSQQQSLINIFANIMDASGFTDYNYDELKSVLKDNNQNINVTYFFADSKSKTLYDVLKEAFLAYQIGSYIDEHGVMRFINLNSVISSNIPTYIVEDSNIVVNSYNENIRAKIGKLRMLYRMPQIKRSVSLRSNAEKRTTVLQQAPDSIWKEDTEDVITYNSLQSDITTGTQNYYQIPASEYSNIFYETTYQHQNHAIVEGEIISSGNAEVHLIASTPTSKKEKYIAVTNQNDLSEGVAQLSVQAGSIDVSYEPTGRMLNVERGKFGTKPSPHIVMSTPEHFDTYFQYINVAGSTMSYGQKLSIVNGYIACPLTFAGTQPQTAIVVPKVESDRGYNTYSAKFQFPEQLAGDKAEAGVYVNITGTTTLNNNAFYVGIVKTALPVVSKIKTVTQYKYTLKYGPADGSNTKYIDVNSRIVDIDGVINGYINNQPKLPGYSANEAGAINLKITKNSVSGNIVIWVLNRRIEIPVSASTYLGVKGSHFGFYALGDAKAKSSVGLSEIYACQSTVDETVSYHFQKQYFLDSMLAGKLMSEQFFFKQAKPKLIGLNIYDVQNVITPSLGAEPLKIIYTMIYPTGSQKFAPSDLLVVDENAVSYSTILNSGFRSKFALVNNSTYAIWTKTGSDYQKLVSSQFAIFSRNVIVLTEQQTVEKILNYQNSNEVIELQSDWIQSKKSAESIMGVIAKASDSFSKDISVEIFGNPLIQVGDIASVTHYLKNILGITFFIQGVSQTFSQGLKTVLTLNQIGYSSSTSKSTTFPKTQQSLNASGTLTLTKINGVAIDANNPAVGSIAGGDVVEISGGSGYAVDKVPQVFFGSTQGFTVTYVDPTTITVITPPHDAGAVDVSEVFNSVTYTTKNYYAFTYLNSVPLVVGDITDLRKLTPGFDGTKYNLDLTWTTPTNSDSYYYDVIDSSGTNSISGNGTGNTLSLTGLIPNAHYSITVTPANAASGETGGAQTVEYTAGSATSLYPLALYTISNSTTSIDVFGFPMYGYKSYKITLSLSGESDRVQYQNMNFGDNTHIIFTGLTPNKYYKVVVDGYTVLDHANTSTAQGIGYQTTDGKQNPNYQLNSAEPLMPNVIGTPIPSIDSNGVLSLSIPIASDTTTNPPVRYDITVNSTTYPFYITNLTKDISGVYHPVVGNLKPGQTYTISVIAINASGVRSVARQLDAYISPTPTQYKPITLSSVSGNIGCSWVGDSYYDSYVVSYYAAGALFDESTTVRSADAWTVGSVVLSTDGINFTDSTKNTGSTFPVSTNYTVTVTGFRDGVKGFVTPATSGTTPATKVNNYVKPVGVKGSVMSQDYRENAQGKAISKTASGGAGGSFIWYNPINGGTFGTGGLIQPPSGDWQDWYWEWEIYYNKTADPKTGMYATNGDYLGGADAEGQFHWSEPNSYNSSYFIVGTSNGGASHPNFFRIRERILGLDNNWYYGPWASVVGKFS